MKKRKALCLALASVFAFSAFSGCSGNNPVTSGSGTSGSTSSAVPDYDCTVEEDPHLASESSADLTFIRPAHDPAKEDDPINIAIHKYEAQYNAKVDIQVAAYSEWLGKIIAAKNAGKSIDVIDGDAAYYPLFAAKQYTEPLDQYVNLDDSSLFSRQQTDTFFKFQGKSYNAAFTDASVLVLFYNKQILSDKGLQDPNDLYKAGNWNWDTFRDMCKAATADTDGDGQNDRWGLASCYDYYFLGANHTSVCHIDNDGKYTLNLDDPALKNALTYAKDAYYDTKWRGLDGDNIFDSWYSGKNLFVEEYDYCETKDVLIAKNAGKFDFDYGVCPFPYGPDNKDKVNVGNAGGYGIGTGCKNPYHAGQLIKMMAKANHADVLAKAQTIPAEHEQLYEELRKSIYNDTYYDSAITCGTTLVDAVCGGTSPAQALAQVKGYYQNILDDVNGE